MQGDENQQNKAKNKFVLFLVAISFRGAWGSVVVKALRYKSMGPRIDPRWFH